MKKITLLIVFLFGTMLHAQVGINTTSPDASSMLDISATNKGVLVPRVSLTNVTLTTLDGTNTAATGLLIWNTNATTKCGMHWWLTVNTETGPTLEMLKKDSSSCKTTAMRCGFRI